MGVRVTLHVPVLSLFGYQPFQAGQYIGCHRWVGIFVDSYAGCRVPDEDHCRAVAQPALLNYVFDLPADVYQLTVLTRPKGYTFHRLFSQPGL